MWCPKKAGTPKISEKQRYAKKGERLIRVHEEEWTTTLRALFLLDATAVRLKGGKRSRKISSHMRRKCSLGCSEDTTCERRAGVCRAKSGDDGKLKSRGRGAKIRLRKEEEKKSPS